MPLYEFACKACGFYQETLMKLSDPMPTICPQCQASCYEKLLSKTSFVLKGQGWYTTDFKGAAPKATPGETTEKAAPPEAPASDPLPAPPPAPSPATEKH